MIYYEVLVDGEVYETFTVRSKADMLCDYLRDQGLDADVVSHYEE